jgi:hypothetical protein
MAEWLVRAHVGTARLLVQAKRGKDALAEYRAAARFAPPGGTDMIPNIADGRGNRQNSNFAQYAKGPALGEALIALARDAIQRRDSPAAQVYVTQAGQTAIAPELRRELNDLNFAIARAMSGN